MENKNRAGHAQINARGDCTDLASAGSGRRNENPPALAVGSVNLQGRRQRNGSTERTV
jgi:hypothetical protein